MDLPKRKSPRIPGYDYSNANYYFVTICTNGKKCIFGDPGVLNWMGKTAEDNLLKIAEINPSIKVDKYVVMPNHVHAILDVRECGDADLTQVIGQYKMSVTKKIRQKIAGMQVWQRSFHDHVIRNQAGYEKIWMYIENNPLKWKEDCFYMAVNSDEEMREGQ